MLKVPMKKTINSYLKRENTGLRHFNGYKDFIEYSNDMDDIYPKIEEYNPKKNCKKNECFQ